MFHTNKNKEKNIWLFFVQALCRCCFYYVSFRYPASEMLFLIINEGRHPRICIDLMTKTIVVQPWENAVYLGAIHRDRQKKEQILSAMRTEFCWTNTAHYRDVKEAVPVHMSFNWMGNINTGT